jgi:hypothetical protein
MATIVPQMAKLSVKDLLETRQRLEADIDKLLTDFTALTGVKVSGVTYIDCNQAVMLQFGLKPHPTVRVELAL